MARLLTINCQQATMSLKISEALQKLQTLSGQTHNLPKTSNKGGVGHHVESYLGIPKTSNCLDCEDGEIKAFPLKKLKNGTLVPKETVAVTMATGFQDASFDEHRAGKKMSNTVFVPYLREGDSVTYKDPIHFDKGSTLYGKLKEDYDTIKSTYQETNTMSSGTGTYLQTRTKGPKDSDSRAFYVKTNFLKEIMKPQ
jgi:hypothetical protein